MNAAVQFLSYLAQAIAGITLYDAGHPARERACDRAYQALVDLQAETPTPTFMFMGDEVLLDSWPLREMRNWDWGARMAAVGVQRVEFINLVDRADFGAFLLELFVRLVGEDVSTAEVRQGRPSNIRYGEVKMKGSDEDEESEALALPVAKLGYSLQEEIASIEWLHGELKEDRQLHLLEASGIVRSLSVAMHSDQSYLIPLVRLKEYDQYTTTHSLNVSVLTMALAEFLGMSPREVRSFGIAGLLHDLGKVKIPNDILNKPGALTDQERDVINSHTVEGARLIIETEQHLDVAAVVAYEHHIRIDGGGYPSMLYERASHPASALVHVCDVFDALRTDRPYREAMSAKRALTIIERGAGSDFEEDVAHAFIQMMKKWGTRIADVNPEDPQVEVLPGVHDQFQEIEVYDLEEPWKKPAPDAEPADDEVHDLDGDEVHSLDGGEVHSLDGDEVHDLDDDTIWEEVPDDEVIDLGGEDSADDDDLEMTWEEVE